MDVVVESRRNPAFNQSDSAWVWRMSGLTRNRTAEPVSRDQILRRERRRKIYFSCSADHEQDWQPYPVDPNFAVSDDHTVLYYCREIGRVLRIGRPGGSVGNLETF